MTRYDALHGKSVTSKVVSVLEAFSTGAPRLSLKQLAESTGLPQSTMYRLASELLLAYGPEGPSRRCSVERLTRYTAHTIVQPGQPRRALTKVRREGVAVANEEMSLGSVSVAPPVLASIFGDLPPP